MSGGVCVHIRAKCELSKQSGLFNVLIFLMKERSDAFNFNFNYQPGEFVMLLFIYGCSRCAFKGKPSCSVLYPLKLP